MKRRYGFIVLCFVIILSTILTACKSETKTTDIKTDSNMIYKSNNVSVLLLNENTPREYVLNEYSNVTKKDAFEQNDVIVFGKVTNVKQVEIEHEYLGTPITSESTLFDLDIAEVLCDKKGRLKNKKTISIGAPYNNKTYEEGLPVLEEGKTYIIFCMSTKDIQNSMELSNYVEFWAKDMRNLIIEKSGDQFIASDLFSDLDSAVSVAEDFNMTENTAAKIATMSKSKLEKTVNDNTLFENNKAIDTGKAKEVLTTVKSRTKYQSYQIWNIVETNYLLDETSLKNYIKQTAKKYK